MEQDGYCRGASKNNETGQLVSKLSTAQELVKQGLSDRDGMIEFARIRKRFGKTAGVAKRSDVFPLAVWRTSAEMAEADEASEHDLVGRRRS